MVVEEIIVFVMGFCRILGGFFMVGVIEFVFVFSEIISVGCLEII